MAKPQHKGWFRIDGVQDGDRTLEQQLIGLQPALAEASGRTLLDLGCAEGLIAREFCKAGAESVRGVEIVQANAAEARRQCAHWPVKIHCQNVEAFVAERFNKAADGRLQWDCVLALAILHKLRNPRVVAEFIAMVVNELAVIRLPPGTPGYVQDARSGNVRCDITEVMVQHGLSLVSVEQGPFGEWMGYYRRR